MFGRRTVITFEKLERSTYRLVKAPAPAFPCDRCRRIVAWLTPNEVVAITRQSLREIFRLIELNQIHFTETEAGLVFVCELSVRQGRT